MKRRRVFCCTVMAICFAVTTIILACDNFGFPESLAIKTDATYSLGFGMEALDMSEFLSVDTLKKSFGDGSDFKVYDYNPGGNADVQHFLIEYAAVNYPLDISEVFDSMNFGNEIGSELNINQTFNVPDLNKEASSNNVPIGGQTVSSTHMEVPFDMTLSFVTDDSLINVVVGEGSLVVAVERSGIPTTITATPDIAITGIDGVPSINNNDDVFDRGKYLIYKTVPLDEKTVDPNEVKLSGKIILTATNTTTIPNGINIKLDVKFGVTKFSSATINLGDIKTEFNDPQPVPASMIDFVKTIDYSEAGISFKYTNTLPPHSDNEVTMKVTSRFLNFPNPSGKTGTLTPNGTIGRIVKNDDSDGSARKIDVEHAANIDIVIKLNLPGATDEHPNYITVKNVAPNQKYELSLSDFEFVLDWTEMTVNTTNLSVGEGTPEEIDFPLDINKMFSDMTSEMEGMTDLVEAIQLPDIPVYMYMSKPNIIDLNSVSGSLKLKSTTTSGSHETDSMLDGEIDMTDRALPISETEVVTQDFAFLPELTSFDDNVFSKVFNEKRTDLKLEYSFGFVGGDVDLRIRRDDVERIKSAGGALSIKAAVYIDIPLKMTVGKDANIDMMKLAGTQDKTDLLDRSEPMSTEEFDNYFSAIKSIGMSLNVGNNIFSSGDNGNVKFVIDDTGTGNVVLGRKEFGLPNLDLELTYEQVSGVLKSVPPYMPQILINLPKGSGFAIPRNEALGMSGKVTVDTDGTIQLFGGNQ